MHRARLNKRSVHAAAAWGEQRGTNNGLIGHASGLEWFRASPGRLKNPSAGNLSNTAARATKTRA
eukprot:7692201-Alexandrium_andersonii.AAC.1